MHCFCSSFCYYLEAPFQFLFMCAYSYFLPCPTLGYNWASLKARHWLGSNHYREFGVHTSFQGTQWYRWCFWSSFISVKIKSKHQKLAMYPIVFPPRSSADHQCSFFCLDKAIAFEPIHCFNPGPADLLSFEWRNNTAVKIEETF